MKPTLLIMAAGMGTRFGGLKQIYPIGPDGQTILSYSLQDAQSAGFSKVVFIIQSNFAQAFMEKIDSEAHRYMEEVAYVYQDVTPLPAGYHLPVARKKPLGTAHAILCAQKVIETPFAVINADDFYGKDAFFALSEFLQRQAQEPFEKEPYSYAMVGYLLQNTLSENGTVSRGICQISERNTLSSIQELHHIGKDPTGTFYYKDEGGTSHPLQGKEIVSLNTWGFTPSVFPLLEDGMTRFLKDNQSDLSQVEYYIPFAVDQMIQKKNATVTVLPSHGQWYGITYADDLPFLQAAIEKMTNEGLYPAKG